MVSPMAIQRKYGYIIHLYRGFFGPTSHANIQKYRTIELSSDARIRQYAMGNRSMHSFFFFLT